MAFLSHVRILGVIFGALLLTLSVWVFLSPLVSPGLYRNRLFHPHEFQGNLQALRAFNAVPKSEHYFAAEDGKRLHGWFFKNPNSRQVFLLCPGNAGDIAGRLDFIKTLLKTGASIFIYEPRGFGLSEGKPSIRHICHDGLSAYDYLHATLGYSPEHIVLYGVSLG